jgi:hypothetical protein
MKEEFIDSIDKDKFKTGLHAIRSGEDVSVIIKGGERPHIGAVVIARPDKESKKVSYTIWTDIGHKDDVVAKETATELVKSLSFSKNVVVIAGLHIDNATKEDINRLVKNSSSLVKSLIESDFFKDLLV